MNIFIFNKRRVISLLAAASVFLFPLTGCQNAKALGEDLTQGITANPIDTRGTLNNKIVTGFQDFAGRLLKESRAGSEKNTLVSPASVYLALAMTANGSNGNTLSEFEQVLGNGLSQKDVNLFCRKLSDRLAETSGSTKLKIANSIWYDKGFKADRAFLQKNADYFGADAFSVDFSNTKTVDMINEWVNEKTKGLIPNIISQLDTGDIMALINTLYLNTAWQNEFNPDDNAKADFKKDDGTAVQCTFLSNDVRNEQVLSWHGAKGVLLPYNDGKLTYMAVLPPDGVTAEEFGAALNSESLTGLMESRKEKKILLHLPKHTINYDITLNDALISMGVKTAFDPYKADFSNMGGADGNIYIGKVIHKTCIKVNEKGTEAAAATGVIMKCTSAPADGYATMIFDRPFVFAVVDTDSGVPVFLGILNNPSE